MTQVNLTKIANLLVDTFVSIEEVSVIQGHIVVTYHSKRNAMDVAYEPVPEGNDDLTIATLLLKLQNDIVKNTHPIYLNCVQ